MKILRILLIITGWSLIAISVGVLIGLFSGIYILPPKAGIVLALIGMGILILAEKQSNITLIDYMMIIAIISILSIF